MSTRKVVTGHNAEGMSTVAVDDIVSDVMTLPNISGWELATVASTGADFVLAPSAEGEPVDVGLVPGATQFVVWRLPPLENGANPAGMHATNTVDYIIVIQGSVSMKMGDGTEVELHRGDCVVQNGTHHEWVNRSGAECVMATIMVGVRRS